MHHIRSPPGAIRSALVVDIDVLRQVEFRLFFRPNAAHLDYLVSLAYFGSDNRGEWRVFFLLVKELCQLHPESTQSRKCGDNESFSFYYLRGRWWTFLTVCLRSHLSRIHCRLIPLSSSSLTTHFPIRRVPPFVDTVGGESREVYTLPGYR